MKHKIGDKVRLLIDVKGSKEDVIVMIPSGIVGVLEERDDNNMFHFVYEDSSKARIVTYVSDNEIELVLENRKC